MRPLLLLCLFSACTVAHAADPLAGVWKGALGASAVVACFNKGEPGSESGSYYYSRHRTPIPLSREGAQAPWKETGDTGSWMLDKPTGATLTGTWRAPKSAKTLPISLALVERPGEQEPCASDAYNLALEVFPPLQAGAIATFNGRKFRNVRIADVDTIEIIGAATPGEKAVNRQLTGMLPKSRADLNEYYEKRREFLGRMGQAAEDETSASVDYWSDDFITVQYSRWTAGMGRRGAGSEYRSWDLKSGAEINLWGWFLPKVEQAGHLSPALKRHLFKGVKEAPECREYYNKGYYQLGLQADGMRFWEEEYGDGCEQSFSVPYEQLAPLMTQEGKQALKRIRAGKAGASPR